MKGRMVQAGLDSDTRPLPSRRRAEGRSRGGGALAGAVEGLDPSRDEL